MGSGTPSERFALATGQLSLDAVVDAVVDAELRGLESAHIGEAGLEADALLAAAAALRATTTIHVGPGIVSIADRHPVALARAAATLDRSAPGRAFLGIGLGDPEMVRAVLGGRSAPGLGALEDAIRICRGLLAGARVEHDGRTYSARIGPPPARAAATRPVPVLVAAVGERTLRSAGRLADGVLLNYGASPEYVRWAVARIREGAGQAGRDPAGVEIGGHVLVARTDAPGAAEQLEAVGRTLRSVLRTPGQGEALAAPAGGTPRRWDAASLRRFAAIGDREACMAHLGELRDAGLGCPILLPSAVRALDLRIDRHGGPALLQ